MTDSGNNPLLIVFTDELNSTARDLKYLKELHESGDVTKYKSELKNSRAELFSHQINNLDNHGEKWTVIKTVGDSLIISLNAEDARSLKDITDKCLGSLFNIWKSSSDKHKIRIACHLTNSREIITGKESPEITKCFKGKDAHLVLSPVLNSIDTDMFGPAMNKAARLASIPKGSLFVVSQELMEFMHGKEDVLKHINNNVPYPMKLKQGAETFNVRAYPIPIINLKGFEAGTIDVPTEMLDKHKILHDDE